MAYILTTGDSYIEFTETKAIRKTNDINKAEIFSTMDEAILTVIRAPTKTKGYYVFDMETKKKCWSSNNNPKRRCFTMEERKIIYNKTGGRCALCGRMMKFNKFTIDHIEPISKNGSNELDNLQPACRVCNIFKSNIRPEIFEERITEIFMFQMEKRLGRGIKWKILKAMVK